MIGLITSDEVMFAGGAITENSSYYLYNGTWYWTMSPYGFYGSSASVFGVDSDGHLRSDDVDSYGRFRPVINVDASKVKISGGGTIDNMYVFS